MIHSENKYITLKEVRETFNDYKKTSLYMCGNICKLNCINCFNKEIKNKIGIKFDIEDFITTKIINNIFIESIVFSGLNWFDEFENMERFIFNLRKRSNMDIIIYTGYEESYIKKEINALKKYKNIIIKFGEYKEKLQPRYDNILGVTLASENQYAKRIEDL